MKDKPLNYRQGLFVKYYTDGDTKGRCEASMISAGYNNTYAHSFAGVYIRGKIKQAIDDRTIEIEDHRKNTCESVDKDFEFAKKQCMDNEGNLKHRMTYVRICENQAKNAGYYAEDNAQQREKAVLSEQEKEEAIEFAKWRLLKGA